MATLIDHILVELNLDAKKFDQGVKKQAEAWLRMRQDAEKSGKVVGEIADKMTQSFSSLATKVAGFIASFLGLEKLTKLGVDLTKTNISLGNLSATTGISVKTLSLWTQAAARAGSSVQSMTSAIEGMDNAIKEFDSSGGGSELGKLLLNLKNRGGGEISRNDAEGRRKTATQMIEDILKGMDRAGYSPQDRNRALRALGMMDRSVIQIFNQGFEYWDKQIKAQEKIGFVTDANVAAARALNEQFESMVQRIDALGRALLDKITEPLKTAFQAVGLGADVAKNRVDNKPGSQPGSAKGSMIRPFFFPWLSNKPELPPAWPLPGSTSGGAQPTPEGSPSGSTGKATAQPQQEASYFGSASYYTGQPSEGGNLTSTGERVDPNSYTGALQSDIAKQYGGLHKTGVWADIIDVRTGKKVRIKLNDTGPLRPGRVVDLSPRAFKEFGGMDQGVLKNMQVHILPPAPPGQPYSGGPVNEFGANATPIPLLSNPRLLRAPRFNMGYGQGGNYSSSETVVHSMIVNGAKPPTDDAYGLSGDVQESLERGRFVQQFTTGPL